MCNMVRGSLALHAQVIVVGRCKCSAHKAEKHTHLWPNQGTHFLYNRQGYASAKLPKNESVTNAGPRHSGGPRSGDFSVLCVPGPYLRTRISVRTSIA